MLSLLDYTRFFIALFAVLTPFGAIPIFLNLTDGQSPRSRLNTARATVATVICVLLSAAFAGDAVLSLFGTSLASFRVGGGIVLLLMGLSMLNAQVSRVQQTPHEAQEAEQRQSVGVVPLGMPVLVGPASISTVIIEMQRGAGWGHSAAVTACILLVGGIVFLILNLATPIGAKLGTIGLNILNRLFGLLLCAIAVESIANGLKALFPALT